MKSRMYAHKKSTREQTPDFSTAPAQPMFQSRPFVVQTQTAQQSQKLELKKSLRQAERYGHHLSQMQLSTYENGISTKNRVDAAEKIDSEKNFPSTALSHDQMPAIQMAPTTKGTAKSSNKKKRKAKSSNKKDAAKADSALKDRIKKAAGKGNQRTFNYLRGLTKLPHNDPKVQEFFSFTNDTNPNAKHNKAKIETTSRDEPINGTGELWGHGMNEPAGTRNIIPYFMQSAGLHPGINPTSAFKDNKGNFKNFNHLDIHQHLRTDTAKTVFPDGTFHAGGLKLDPTNKSKSFHSGGNANYDKAMDEAQASTRTPAERFRKLTAAHLNATAKPNNILDPNGPYNKGTTVEGLDLSTPLGKQKTAENVGQRRNKLKKLMIKVNEKVDMTGEPKGGTPTVSPVDLNYPVKSPGTPIATDPQLWKEYLNK